MRKVYLIPNAITAFGLVCGLFVIFKTALVDPSRDLFSVMQASVILLLIAAIADLADGAVARLIHAESEFGVQFDSLADAVTFGIAPPLLVLRSFTNVPLGKFINFVVIIASMIYSLCGVLRLVRYNVQSLSHKKETKDKKHFTGLPIPAAAALIVSASLVPLSELGKEYLPISAVTRAIGLSVILIVIGYFMVSRWKFPSVKALHFRVPSFYLVFAVGVFAVILLYGILDYFSIALFLASWFYLIGSLVLSIIRLFAGRHSKTLIDFEPEEEERDHE